MGTATYSNIVDTHRIRPIRPSTLHVAAKQVTESSSTTVQAWHSGTDYSTYCRGLAYGPLQTILSH
jgi:hypothetical protein